jgi:arsenical-resistance protein 2
MLSLKIASILLIDVRSEAFYPHGGTIRGSLHIPARGFWWNRGVVYELAYKADVEWVCFVGLDDEDDEDEGGGKTVSRAEVCAGWFADHVRGTVGDGDMQILVAEAGLEGWVQGGEGFVTLMDGFERGVWEERRRIKKVGRSGEGMLGRDKKRKVGGGGGADGDGDVVDAGAEAESEHDDDAGDERSKKQKTLDADENEGKDTEQARTSQMSSTVVADVQNGS